jgi:glycosyltransferase involved in cell wall biosynthesis
MQAKHPRLWIATEIYYPEKTSTGYLLTKLAEGLAAAGPVAVLCAQPSYERKGETVPRQEQVNGVSIIRVGHPRFNRASLVGRTVNMAVVTTRMFLRACGSLRRGDVVIVVTNPPLLPFAICLAARLRGAHPMLLVHDVYPEAAILAGVLRPNGALAKLWRAANNWLFDRMDRIIVLGRDAFDLFAARLSDGARRLRIIPNWADVGDIVPTPVAENSLLKSLQLDNRFVLGYAGNMGRVHDIQTLIEAAHLLRDAVPDAHLLFVGNGAKEGDVKAAAALPGSNITIVGPMSREEQPIFLNACHVSIMSLARGMAGIGVPSRLYNALAAGRPVLAAVDRESEPARVIREEDVGIHVDSGDTAALVAAVARLREDAAFREAAGRRAREAAVRRFEFSRILDAYRALLAERNWPVQPRA